MESKNGIMFWVGEGGCYSCAYGCDWFCKVKDTKELYEYLEEAEEIHNYDKYVIHLDSLDLDFLFWMIHSGRVTPDYEVRLHGYGEDSKEYAIFRAIVDHEWKCQDGWFTRERKDFDE